MEFPATRRRRLAVVVAGLCLTALCVARGVNAEDGVYRPTPEQCQDRLSEAGRTAGQSNVGWHISSLCSSVTMWWPGNERRCCQTVSDYVGEGGGLEYCLCDPDAADSVVSSFGWLVDVGALNDKCGKYDVVIPYKDNSVCPPPDPNAPNALEDDEAPAPAAEEEPSALIPSQSDCISMAEEIGEGELVRSFAGCFFGATNGCCSSAVELVGAGGGLANCLCDPESASFISEQAKSYGMNVDDIMNGCVKKDYEVPFNFNEFCPARRQPAAAPSQQSSPPPPSSEPSPSPALISDPSPPQKESPSPAPEPAALAPMPQSSTPAQRKPLPTLDECVSKAEAVGQAAIVSKVIPCLAGGGIECCNAALELVGNGGDLELCLCSEESASFITDETEKLGFDLKGILSKCVDDLDVELPFFGNEYCGGGGGGGSEAPALKQEPPPMTREEPSVPAQQEQQQPLPTLDECVSKAEAVGQAAIVSKVIPCLAGGGLECCNAALELVGNGGDLELCLCSEESASFITDETEKLGFDLKGILSKCVDELDVELPFFGNEYCGGGGGGGSEAPALKQEPPPMTREEPSVPAQQEQQQPLPTLDECVSKAEAVGQAAIVSKVIPCLAGGGMECCNAALELVGNGGDLELCLCSEESASFITDETEKLGFDLKGILSKCVDELDVELPFFGNEYCGGGGGSEAPEQEEPQQEEEKTEEKEPEKAAAVEEEPPAAPGSAAVEVIELPPGVTTLPSTVECGKAGSEIGESQIIAALMPCLDQPSEACCAAAENLIGPGGALAFCGCNLELVGAIEALAGDLGLTPQQVQSYVSACPRVPLLPAGNCPAAPERESNLLGPGSSEERQEGPAAVGELAAPGDDLLATPSNPIQPTEDPRSSTGGSGGPGIPTWVWGAVFAAAGVGIVLVGLTIYVYGFGQVPVRAGKSSRGNKKGAPQEAIASSQAAAPAAGATGNLGGVSSYV